MTNNIEEQLNKLPKAKLSRKKDFVLRWQFLKISWRKSWQEVLDIIKLRKLAPIFTMITVLALIVFVPSYAYASSNVTRGNILYPIKQGIEKVELSLADTPNKKVEVYTKLASRRLAEANTLNNRESKQSENSLAETIDEMVELTVSATTIVDTGLKNNRQENVTEKIREAKRQQLTVMEKIANKQGLRASDKLLDSLVLAIDDLKKEKTNSDQENNVPKFKIATSSEAYRFEHSQSAASSASTVFKIATSTATSTIKSRIEKDRVSQEIIEQYFDITTEHINSLKESLSSEDKKGDLNNEQTEEFFKRLDDRIQKVRDAINSGNLNQANGLIKSTEALSNNANSFIKKHYTATSTENMRSETKIRIWKNIRNNNQ